LSATSKSALSDILDNSPSALSTYLDYFMRRLLFFDKVETTLTPCYQFIHQVCSLLWLSPTFTPILTPLLDLLLQTALKPANPKYSRRCLKMLNVLFPHCLPLISESPGLQEQGLKVMITYMQSPTEKLFLYACDLYRGGLKQFVGGYGGLKEFIDDVFLKQVMESDRGVVREKALEEIDGVKERVKWIVQVGFDKEVGVRKVLYKRLLKGLKQLLKVSEGRLYKFLNRGFCEVDEEAKRAFYDMLIGYLVKPEEEEEMKIDGEKIVSFDYDFKYEGGRKRKARMSFFDLFMKLKLHKMHYVDGFSLLPQKFFGFLFGVFERADIIKWMEEVYQKIVNVIVHKVKNESVSFAHFSFIRLAVEYTKILLSKEFESYDIIENLIPDIDDYSAVFTYFANKSKCRREELEILSEWSKYALNLTYTIPSIRERLRELMINYISEPDPSIKYYTNIINSALESEREYEAQVDDIDFCSTDHRDFKSIYLRKRTISDLWKPVTWNAYISDPDDVWVIMTTVLFQISLDDIKDFISSIKDSIRMIREDLDKEIEADGEEEDQVDFSIPHKKHLSMKTLQKLTEKVSRLLEAKKASSNYSSSELSKIEVEYDQSIGTIQTVKKELENWCLHEKIINRRTLKIIQIFCQLTVNNGLDDETMTWAANMIIEHIKGRDSENMDICLSCIVDILLFDKDLSASFLKIYQSLLYLSDVSAKTITDDNPKSSQIVTIIKSLYDMFCILENFGLDAFEDHCIIGREDIPRPNVEDNDVVRLKLSNQLLSTLMKKFMFCCNIHIRNLWSEGLIKILFERKLGNPPPEIFVHTSSRIMKNESVYW
jgi:hypothetical protein